MDHGLKDILEYISPFFQTIAVPLIVLYVIDLLTSPRRIKGIANVYCTIPIWGSLSILFPAATTWKDSPCLKFYRLAQKLHSDVYQIRLGNRIVVVANSYQAIMKLWCFKGIRANNSRPIGNTFHSLLSREGIYTIGTTPFSQDYLRMRKFVAMNLLNESKTMSKSSKVIDKESNELIVRILKGAISSNSSTSYIGSDTFLVRDLLRQAQYFHLAVALMLTYGYQIDYSTEISRKQAEEVMYVENQITKVRSHVQNFQDFLPRPFQLLVDLFTNKAGKTRDLYERRKQYLDRYFKYAKENVTYPTKEIKDSLMYQYFMDGGSTINRQQMASVCLTMISAGLDNAPLNFVYEIHQLSNSPHIWHKAYDELMRCYDNNPVAAYRRCSQETKCQYITAMVQETLRLFTVLPMALPRETTADIPYNNSIIPKGSMLFMNCWAGNHDSKAFYKPMEYIPERFLDTDLKHLAFGIGSRMCLGNHLALQELYVLTCRFIILFEFQNPKVSKLNPLALNQYPESIAIEPVGIDFELKLRSRQVLLAVLGGNGNSINGENE